ncbi:histone PARylation factor 1 [Colletes gigas]|uniref:histone PARylation factor 1 n=1 Tax=Colletes gigas TaxID=935657 RepID=UPI001C9B86B6|nr:histone PARylation factor 1 [Colletes gigas]
MCNNENDQHKTYQEDSRIPCRYGIECYQKNPVHHKIYKHPPTEHVKKQIITKHSKKRKTQDDRKTKKKNSSEVLNDSQKKKVQKIHDNMTDESIVSTVDNTANNDDKKIKTTEDVSNSELAESVNHSVNRITITSLLKDCNINIESGKLLPSDAQTVISCLFLTEMPEDFFQFFEFCKSISKTDPLNALKNLQLQLVGPYDVFKDDFLSSNVSDKKALLRHWRYYYDPAEFQTVIKIDDKDNLHFGYWRDDSLEKPVFVAKNKANVNCIIEPVAENIFGSVNIYIEEKLKLANPFQKIRIAQLHQKLRNYAKEKNITLDKQTNSMLVRKKEVVASTFHKAGIVVPYDSKTEIGYRDLAVTNNELDKILKQIEQASTSEAKKPPMSKLEEVIRLATIAADECDFGTCLELGHDLFSCGVPFVQNKALNMLSVAYNLLQRPQLLEIARAHLEDRRRGSNLSVLY